MQIPSKLSWLFNAKRRIKDQLLIGSFLVILFSTACSLALCLGLIYSLKYSATHTASEQIESQTKSQMLANAQGMAAAIDQKIQIVAQSIVLPLTIQAYNYLNRTAVISSTQYVFPRNSLPSYREYLFQNGCAGTTCPLDYSAIKRVGNTFGSTLASSIQMYNSATGQAVSSNLDWDGILANDIALQAIVETSSVLDEDYSVMYNSGPDSTVFFYSAFKVSANSSNSYYSLRRTFPGINLDNSTYDSSTRSWFIKAPNDFIYLGLPYVETFSNELVITISSKKSILFDDRVVQIVGAANMKVSAFATIVQKFSYLNSGFAVLLNKESLDVISWGQNSTFNYQSGTFLKLSDLDKELADVFSRVNQYNAGSFSYTRKLNDGNDGNWFCSYVPFLNIKDGSKSDRSSKSLMLLVLVKGSEALASLPELEEKISSTSNKIASIAGITCLLIFLLGSLAALFLSLHISKPLVDIKVVSEKISSIAVEEARDYREVFDQKMKKSTRRDELGLLNSHLNDMVHQLQKLEEDKASRPRYPDNPFFNSRGMKPWELPSAPNENEENPPEYEDFGQFKPPTSRTTINSAVNTDAVKISVPLEIESSRDTNKRSQKRVWKICSIGTLISLNSLLIVLLFFGLMIYCIIILKKESNLWVENTGNVIQSQENSNLLKFSLNKAEFSTSFFDVIILDGLVLLGYVTKLFSTQIAQISRNQTTYSLDYTNLFGLNLKNPNYSFSGYFSYDHGGCRAQGTCKVFHDSDERKINSFLDLKFSSFFHALTSQQFILVAQESTGFMEYYPYTTKTYGAPKSCFVEETPNQICRNHQTQCDNGLYPYYEARCRTWFVSAKNSKIDKVSFLAPRTAVNGDIVITAVSPVYINGVFNASIAQNIEANTLSDNINKLKFLRKGYSYIVYSENPENIFIHPNLGNCKTLECAEYEFSNEEYSYFNLNFLQKMKLSINGSREAFSFVKGGNQWKASFSSFSAVTDNFTIISVVPVEDILYSVNEVKSTVSSTLNGMIVGFAFLILIFFFVQYKFSALISQLIVDPINNIIELCSNITKGNLDKNIPDQASSLEMKSLLESFGAMIISLRFANDDYARGDLVKAKMTFESALNLFQATSNQRGIGIAHNNLGAVYLSEQNFAKSRFHYEEAIKIVKDMISNSAPAAQIKLKQILSDRMGNLALMELEEKKFAEAFKKLEAAFSLDQETGNTRGWVIKQGILGQWYLKQDELADCKRVFESTLRYLEQQRDESSMESKQGDSWNPEEIPIAIHISWYGLATYFHKIGDFEKAEQAYFESLIVSKKIDLAFVKKSLLGLVSLYSKDFPKRIPSIQSLADAYGIKLSQQTVSSSDQKRLFFSLDYSGSMAGSKIKAAVNSILSIYDTQISNDDQMMLTHFNDRVTVDFQFSSKSSARGNRKIIENLVSPNGGTALWDAVIYAVESFSSFKRDTQFKNWIVLLTDGEDNSSPDACINVLEQAKGYIEGLLIIGVGVTNSQTLEQLCRITSKGKFMFAESDATSISEAFQHAMHVIQGQVLLEEF
jgi:tetratricopeptide (TPR) repeat protein/uncharacterized protein YegL